MVTIVLSFLMGVGRSQRADAEYQGRSGVCVCVCVFVFLFDVFFKRKGRSKRKFVCILSKCKLKYAEEGCQRAWRVARVVVSCFSSAE